MWGWGGWVTVALTNEIDGHELNYRSMNTMFETRE